MYGAMVYLVARFFLRIGVFFDHWYRGSARRYSNFVMNQFEWLDRFLAIRITARNLLSPLYGDYSVIGYVFGFVFRLLRIAVAAFVYAFFIGIALVAYCVWLAIPPFVVAGILLGF